MPHRLVPRLVPSVSVGEGNAAQPSDHGGHPFFVGSHGRTAGGCSSRGRRGIPWLCCHRAPASPEVLRSGFTHEPLGQCQHAALSTQHREAAYPESRKARPSPTQCFWSRHRGGCAFATTELLTLAHHAPRFPAVHFAVFVNDVGFNATGEQEDVVVRYVCESVEALGAEFVDGLQLALAHEKTVVFASFTRLARRSRGWLALSPRGWEWSQRAKVFRHATWVSMRTRARVGRARLLKVKCSLSGSRGRAPTCTTRV